MQFHSTPIQGAHIIELNPFHDERGWFVRALCKEKFKEIGHMKEWVQVNHSCSYKAGSIRGMHYQHPPYAEIKMVRCTRGSIYDVIIDIRKNSTTFLQWFGIELSEENQKMLYIPEGFAHGFQCLTNHCELIYHVSEFYTPSAEGGIRYDDSYVNIKWPLPVSVVSQKDISHPYLTSSFKGI